jgi:hypothetical protein
MQIRAAALKDRKAEPRLLDVKGAISDGKAVLARSRMDRGWRVASGQARPLCDHGTAPRSLRERRALEVLPDDSLPGKGRAAASAGISCFLKSP